MGQALWEGAKAYLQTVDLLKLSTFFTTHRDCTGTKPVSKPCLGKQRETSLLQVGVLRGQSLLLQPQTLHAE